MLSHVMRCLNGWHWIITYRAYLGYIVLNFYRPAKCAKTKFYCIFVGFLQQHFQARARLFCKTITFSKCAIVILGQMGVITCSAFQSWVKNILVLWGGADATLCNVCSLPSPPPPPTENLCP